MRTPMAMLLLTFSRSLAFILVVLLTVGCSAKEQPPLPTEVEQQGLSGVYPADAETAYAKARVLWGQGGTTAMRAEQCSDPELAIQLLNKAIELAPNYSQALARRGLAKSEIGMREEAFDDLTAAIRLNPSVRNYAYRGLVSLRSGQIVAAKRDLDYSLELNPKQHVANNFLGILLLLQDDASGACRAFDKGCSHGDCSFIEAARSDGLCS